MTPTRQTLRRALYAGLTALFAVASAAPASAQFRPRPLYQHTPEDYHVEAAVDFWFPAADITIASTSQNTAGTDIDFRNDLGLVDQKFPAFHVQLKAGRSKLRFQYVPISYTQSATLSRDVIFNGRVYRAGLAVNSAIDWKAYRFGYEFDVVQRPRGYLGLIVEAKYTDVSASLTAPVPGSTTSLSESDQASAPIPAIGGTARVYPAPKFAITADLTGVALPHSFIKDATGHYLDFDVFGTLDFTDRIGVQGGYRTFDVDYQFKTDSGSFTLKGLYFGAVVRY